MYSDHLPFRVPLSQGKPIEWKPPSSEITHEWLRCVPLSQGKPIEWKQPISRVKATAIVGSPLAGETN